MKGINIKGVIVANVVVVALDFAVGAVMGVVMLLPQLRAGMNESEIMALADSITTSTPTLVSSLIIGTATTMLGGYVAASMAKSNRYLNAGTVGAAGVLLGFCFLRYYPLWFNISGMLMAFPAALAGGHLAREKENVQHPPQAPAA